MRCGQDDPFSADNGREAFPSNATYLGKQITPSQDVFANGTNELTASGIGNVVELIGTVHPSDFCHEIIFSRDSIDEYAAVFSSSGSLIQAIASIQGQSRGSEPPGNDPTYAEFQDRDPRPNGRIFDIDTPGFPLVYAAFCPIGSFLVQRINFLQYAVFSSRRCSNDFAWHSKTTIRCEEVAGVRFFDFYTRPSRQDDNSCGPGHSTTAP